MNRPVSRRFLLAVSAAAAAAGAVRLSPAIRAAESKVEASPRGSFRYCLNTSTIRGQKLGIVGEVDTAGKAGYDAIEPWIGTLLEYKNAGGSMSDLRKRIADHGMTVESAIGFANWIVDDDAARAKGLEEAKRDMDLVAEIGGKRVAAPPVGAHKSDAPKLDLFTVAKRYRALLEVGDTTGVVPEVEVWGFSKNLSRLGEAVFVAIEAGHPKACVLPDVYHVYKGGSEFHGLRQLSGACVQVIHTNDYPADPPRETINDSHRVYPGDGVAPLTQILRDLSTNQVQGQATVLSLELFNKKYWEQDALEVARTGLAKMKAAVANL